MVSSEHAQLVTAIGATQAQENSRVVVAKKSDTPKYE